MVAEFGRKALAVGDDEEALVLRAGQDLRVQSQQLLCSPVVLCSAAESSQTSHFRRYSA